MTNLDAAIAELRLLAQMLDPSLNKNERVLAYISACILLSVTTRGDIACALIAEGWEREHIMSVLNGSTGSNPGRFRFGKTADGQYFEHAPQVT
jgi:hypothetical protein